MMMKTEIVRYVPQPHSREPFTMPVEHLIDHSQIRNRDAYEPTLAEARSPIFNALWSVMKHQDVLLPDGLRSGATGNDVMIVMRRFAALGGVGAAATPAANEEKTDETNQARVDRQR